METREHIRMPEPAWLTGEKDPEFTKKRTRFWLSIACLYYSESGQSGDLAKAIGLTPNSFAVMKTRGKVSPEIAVALETALGRERFPRELFRPDIFKVA